MSDLEWPAISAGVAAIAAGIACVSASIAFVAARIQLRLADFNNSLEVQKQLSEAERRVAAPNISAEQQAHEIRSFLNLLEVLALMVNRQRVGKSASHLIGNYLIEAWVWAKTTDGVAALIEDATTGPSTFQEIGKFSLRNRVEMEAQIRRRRALGNPGHGAAA